MARKIEVSSEMEAAGGRIVEEWSNILDPFALARKVYDAMASQAALNACAKQQQDTTHSLTIQICVDEPTSAIRAFHKLKRSVDFARMFGGWRDIISVESKSDG